MSTLSQEGNKIVVVAHSKNVVQMRLFKQYQSLFWNIRTRHWQSFRKKAKSRVGENLDFKGMLSFFVTQTDFVEFKHLYRGNNIVCYFNKRCLQNFVLDIKSGKFDSIN